MGENKNKKGKTVQPKTDQQLAEAFIKDYNSLCKKHQHQIVTNPAFQSRDDGTFSVVLQTSVGRLPQENTVK